MTRPVKLVELEQASAALRAITDTADVDRALRVLELFGVARGGRAFVHEGEPVAKARARVNRRTGRFYTPAPTMRAERDLAWCFRAAMVGRDALHGPVAVVALLSVRRRVTDCDNLMKTVLDGGTKGGAWGDDRQVRRLAVWVAEDRDRPRSVIAFGRLHDD